ncbi:hypothetical protein [Tenacibaculum agarivorans]|uniref:hypothetical protein n=1 Tax=Tenacibaculum agarivorans TaxID=1908389 RepID=UPI001180BEFA|nr:hypothetical protein [Tenacibaculum agarivorans]
MNNIIQGHFNEFKSLFVKDENLVFLSRERICNNCPLKTGNSCNSSKYIHPLTKEFSNYRKQGFVRGCGCRLSAKQRAKGSSCPAGFWGGEFKNESIKG